MGWSSDNQVSPVLVTSYSHTKKKSQWSIICIQLKLFPHISHTSLELASKINLKGQEGIQIQGSSCLPHLRHFKINISSVQFSCLVVSICDPINRSAPGLPVHHQLPEFTQTQVHRVSDAIQPSHPLLSPSPPALNPSQHQSFPMSQLFAWGGQSTGVSSLASFLPKKSQGLSPLDWTSWISLQSKGLSRVFSNTTVQKHQFFGTQLSSQSSSHIHTRPLEKP